MSFDLVRAVRDLPNLKSPAKAVLLCLALRTSDAEGPAACWPSHATIARDSGFGASTVRRALAELVSAGYVRIEERRTTAGDRDSNRYVLVLDAERAHLPSERAEVCSERADPSLQSERTGVPRASDKDKEVRSNPKTNRGTRLPEDWSPSPALVAFAREKGVHNVDHVAEEFRDHWRSVAGHHGVKVDWDATFRNRVRYLAERRGPGAGVPRRQPRQVQPMLGDADWMRLPSERRQGA